MQHLISSLSVGDCPVHRLRKNSSFSSFFLNRCTGHSPTDSDDIRCCIETIRPLEDEQRTARNMFFFCCGAATQHGSWPPHSWGFLDHTQRRSTVGRTPLDEWSARRRDLYLTTHNTHNRQISMPPVGFEPTISAGERPQTYAFRPRGHWDRRSKHVEDFNKYIVYKWRKHFVHQFGKWLRLYHDARSANHQDIFYLFVRIIN